MDQLRTKLLMELRKIDGLEARLSSVSGGTALFFRGKPFAHFHNGNELDLRLTKKRIKELGLSHPRDSIDHPNRSPNSAWIELRFVSADDIARLTGLVEMAICEL